VIEINGNNDALKVFNENRKLSLVIELKDCFNPVNDTETTNGDETKLGNVASNMLELLTGETVTE